MIGLLSKWEIFSKKFLTNISWTVLAKATAMLGFFALDICMARILGKDSYGEWSFYYSAVLIMAHVCWFGIDASVKVFVSKQETKQELSDCLKASIRLRLIVSGLFLLVITAASGYLADTMEHFGKYKNLHVLMYGAGVLVFLSSFSEFYKALSIGMQEYRNLFLVTLAEYGGYFVCSLVAVLFLKNNTGILAGYIMAGIFTALLGQALIKKHLLQDQTGNAGKERQKEILFYAMPLLVTSIGEIILQESDTFFLGLFSIPAQVSVYAIGKKLCSKLYHINYTLCITVLPQMSTISKENCREKLDRFRKFAILNILLTICVAAGLLLMSGFFIPVLYGEEYGDAVFIFRLLLIYYVQRGISYYFALFLEFQKQAVFESICYFITIAINIGLEICFVSKFGALGAALAAILSYLPYTILVTVKAVQVLRQYKMIDTAE